MCKYVFNVKASKPAADEVQNEKQKHVQHRDSTKTRPRPGFTTLCCLIDCYNSSYCSSCFGLFSINLLSAQSGGGERERVGADGGRGSYPHFTT